MKLATYADKPRLEEIINDPLLKTWTACDLVGDQHRSADSYLAIPSFAVIGTEGCFMAHNIGKGRYVVHTNLLPQWRGTAALRAAREALRVAFLQTDATELVSMVPDNIPQALWFAKAMGMKVAFTRPSCWPAMGKWWPATFVEMTLDDWIRTGACSTKGRWFHDKLNDNSHPDDPVHDAYVGAAVEMISAGKVSKAVRTYNRWAAFALYQPIKVLSDSPLRIDIRSHVLRVEEGNFNVEASHA